MEAEPETKVIERESTPKEDSASASASAPFEALAVGRAVGRYELVHRLGHGGMAAVYLGRATGRAGFEKLVAVKVIHPHLAAEPEFVEMFLDEARIAARLHHPHVVEIHDLGEDDGAFFMVMEYVEGETLASLLRQLRKHGERLPLPSVLQVVADACEGLASAHDLTHPDGRPMHLVHRDVSPHNLLVGMDGRVKVVDFGIAKATGRRSSTRTGQLRGKLAYMSPEQAGGDPIDHRTDLFALGVVLWELLTNERLFMADTEAEVVARVSACDVPDIRERCDDLPDGVATLVDRALARDREERFPTAQDMLREVRALLRTLDPEVDPREELAGIMDQQFSARVGYIRAAIRRASETGTQTRAANDPIPPHEATRATRRPSTSPSRVTGSGPAALGPATHTHTLTASIAAAPARHWGLWLLLPLVGAVGGAAMVTRGFSRSDAEPVQQARATPTMASAEQREAPVAATPTAPAAATIKWNFDTEPAGARVTLDGQVQPQLTPFMIELPRGEQAIEVEVSRDGYVPLVRHLAPLISDNFSYRLDPVPAAARPRTRLRTRPKPRPKPRPERERDEGAPEATADDDGGRRLAPPPDWDAVGTPRPTAPSR